MSTLTEVILPLAIAAYAGYSDMQQCAPTPHPHPLAENMCSTYREGLRESCSVMLGFPIPGTTLQLGARRTVSRIEFAHEVKESIREAYGVCTAFWTGKIDYQEYLRQTAEKVSVLDRLYRSLGPSLPPGKITQMAEAMQIPEALWDAALRKLESNWGAAAGDAPVAKPEGVPPPAAAAVSGSMVVTAGVPSAGLVPRQGLPPVDAKPKREGRQEAKPIASVSFGYADARLSPTACSGLATRVASAKGAPGAASAGAEMRLRVVGFADPIGEVSNNVRLAAARAGAAAACLVKSAAVSPRAVRPEGGGILKLTSEPEEQARRASVYFDSIVD